MGGRSGRKQPTKEVAIEFPPGVDKKHVDRYASILFEPPVSVMSYSTLFWKPYSQHMTDIVNRAVMVSKGKIWSFRQEYVRFAAMKNNEAAEKLKLRQPDESKCQKTGSKLDSDDSSEDEDDADDDTDDENNSKKLEIPKKPPFQPPFPHDSPPLEVFERFCDLLGEHEPSNRFLLLRDGPVSDHPFVSSEGEDNLTEQHCCHCIINDSLDWLCERDKKFHPIRFKSCVDEHLGSTFPFTYEDLMEHAQRHAQRPNNYCIFHKLIVVYLRTLGDLEEKNRKSIKGFHLCISNDPTKRNKDKIPRRTPHPPHPGRGFYGYYGSSNGRSYVGNYRGRGRNQHRGNGYHHNNRNPGRHCGRFNDRVYNDTKYNHYGNNHRNNSERSSPQQSHYRHTRDRCEINGSLNDRSSIRNGNQSEYRSDIRRHDGDEINLDRNFREPIWDGERNRLTKSYESHSTIIVDHKSDEDHNIPPSNESEGSSKKRKHDVTDNDVSALTDSTTHKLSDILPMALNLFKDKDAKSLKIHCDTTNGISVEINDGNSFGRSSNGMKTNNNNASTISLTKKQRFNLKRRSRRQTKRRIQGKIKELIGKDKELIGKDKELIEKDNLLKEINKKIEDGQLILETTSNMSLSRMETDSPIVEDRLCVDGKSTTNKINHTNNNLLNEKPCGYTVTVQPNVESLNIAGLSSINENTSMCSVHSSVELAEKKQITVVNENNLRKSNNSMISALTNSSSSSEGIYDVENNWEQLRKRMNLEEAVKAIMQKFRKDKGKSLSLIHKDSLENGLSDLKKMYNVSSKNPMAFGMVPFIDEQPAIITSNLVHRPDKPMFPAHVLLIGVGYPDDLRSQWMSVDHPMQYAYVQHNPLMAYSVPDMNSMTVLNHETKQQVKLSNVVKRDFLRALVVEKMFKPCRIFTVNDCKDCVRASALSAFEINCNVNSHDFVSKMKEANWKIDKVIFDNYRMIPSYVRSQFTKSFFTCLKDMARLNILNDNTDDPNRNRSMGSIFLPFNDHFFYYVHVYKMTEYYTIEYLPQEKVNYMNNTLHAVTDSNLFKKLAQLHKLELEKDHARNVTCKRNQILDYLTNIEITKEDLSAELDKIIWKIEDVRYIKLVKKNVRRNNNE